MTSGKSFSDDFETGEGRGMGEPRGVVYGDCFLDDGLRPRLDGFIAEQSELCGLEVLAKIN